MNYKKQGKRIIAGLLAFTVMFGSSTQGYVPARAATAYNAEIDGSIAGQSGSVRLNAAGGEGVAAEKEVFYGQPYGTLPTPVREGYIFTGWYSAADGGERVDENSIGTPDITELFAHWKPLVIRVDLYGGTDEIDCIEATFGRTYAGLPELEKEGFIFDTDIIGLNQKTFCLRVLPIKSYFFTLFTHSPLTQGRIFTQKPRKENSEWQKP